MNLSLSKIIVSLVLMTGSSLAFAQQNYLPPPGGVPMSPGGQMGQNFADPRMFAQMQSQQMQGEMPAGVSAGMLSGGQGQGCGGRGDSSVIRMNAQGQNINGGH